MQLLMIKTVNSITFLLPVTEYNMKNHTYTHTRLTAPCPGLPG